MKEALRSESGFLSRKVRVHQEYSVPSAVHHIERGFLSIFLLFSLVEEREDIPEKDLRMAVSAVGRRRHDNASSPVRRRNLRSVGEHCFLFSFLFTIIFSRALAVGSFFVSFFFVSFPAAALSRQ